MNVFDRKRRLFVGGMIATAASLYAAAIGRGALKACGVEEANVGLADLRSLIRIGCAYLDEAATRKEESTLHAKLPDERHVRSADLAANIQRHILGAEGRTQEEFQRGDTVLCDGWVLAKSEARICALVAISYRASAVD